MHDVVIAGAGPVGLLLANFDDGTRLGELRRQGQGVTQWFAPETTNDGSS